MGKPLGNAQRLLESLWAILKGYRKIARTRPNARRQPKGEEAELPCGYWQRRGNYVIFSEGLHFIL
jgi:hypothetical protein